MRPLEGHIHGMYEFEGGPVPMGYWTKGHVDKDEFAREVMLYSAEGDSDNAILCTAEDVAHTYYRNVPFAGMKDVSLIFKAKGPGRGAYPVTEIDVL